MKKKAVLLTVLAVLLIGGGAGGYYYYRESSKYISTEDAKVQGDLRAIGSLSAGKLLEWRYQEGEAFAKGDVLGIVETSPSRGNSPATTTEIVASEQGTLIQSNAVQNQTVAPGATLAMSADLNRLYITANLQETEITEVQVGNRVTFTIDAFKDVTFTGRVEKIGLGTNSSFSLLPSSNTSGNYTKVIQRIPVKISIDDYQGKRLIPGLNATVKIEK
ncbi:efflux RND transporter periplasmic adaptor subunit [Paenibacillus validus]|uniref:HlyD family efflux transporter periplasmic adaptor subunit n=1 Tax=Paenibacillus validus TaxID=44253 RepID=A0A7X2ZAT8_9BACL|nr:MULTISPECIES: efflux RND transporter periplasmic adaptor subunit [Paenibacillus]MED4603823.1 efflux RND transporter periplasmic adaptor subunit [Paenibacillus validus]MED4608819.1 efflux RND transporter periplasmic adaptor subunit [Paenibacillus validus]MUG71493.1 HlyD family efflux transporter periplasmic adaptor subunit [Paenibacillus validus]